MSRGKKSPTHEVFATLAKREELNEEIRNTLKEWSFNKFSKELRYNRGCLIYKNTKTTRSYNILQLDEDSQISLCAYIMNELVVVKPIAMTEIVMKPNELTDDFSKINQMTKKVLISRYVDKNTNIPSNMKPIFKATIHTGLLIKVLIPNKHITMKDGEIVKVDDIEIDLATNQVRLKSIVLESDSGPPSNRISISTDELDQSN